MFFSPKEYMETHRRDTISLKQKTMLTLWPYLAVFARLHICILDFGLVLMGGVITKQWVSKEIGDIEMTC